jgi:hypothetical protein
VVQILTRARALDSRFRGNDDIQDAPSRHPHSRESGNNNVRDAPSRHPHSRESGNPMPVSEPWRNKK